MEFQCIFYSIVINKPYLKREREKEKLLSLTLSTLVAEDGNVLEQRYVNNEVAVLGLW